MKLTYPAVEEDWVDNSDAPSWFELTDQSLKSKELIVGAGEDATANVNFHVPAADK